MLFIGAQPAEEIPHRERQHQADDRGLRRKQQAAAKNRGVPPNAGQVGKGNLAVTVGQGIPHNNAQRHHNKQDHPHQVEEYLQLHGQ